MLGVILVIVAIILLISLLSDFHVFTAYTFNIEEAYEEFEKWKKNYEQTTKREIIILDIKRGGSYIDFYYKTIRKVKKQKNNPR